MTDPEQVQAGVERIEAEVGPIEILVNNAGLQHRQPLVEISVADWNRVIDADLTSAFLVGREVARYQLGRASGKITNVCSVQSDLLGRPSAAGGLQINGIAPGYIHTEMCSSRPPPPTTSTGKCCSSTAA